MASLAFCSGSGQGNLLKQGATLMKSFVFKKKNVLMNFSQKGRRVDLYTTNTQGTVAVFSTGHF